MNDRVNQIAEDIANLKISDAVKLIDVLCEKLGIPKDSLCAAPVAAAGGAAGGEAAVEAKTEFDVCMTSFGEKKLDVIKVVKNLTGLGLKESKELVESCPKVIKEKLSKDDAEKLKKELEAAGAICELK